MTQTRRREMVEKEIVVATRCDACSATAGAEPAGWHQFSSSHGDWGNDSVESWEQWDVCSFACYLAVVGKVFDSYGKPGEHSARSATLKVDDKDWSFVRDMLMHERATTA